MDWNKAKLDDVLIAILSCPLVPFFWAPLGAYFQNAGKKLSLRSDHFILLTPLTPSVGILRVSYLSWVFLLQFICGLSLCCGTQANLSRDEIQKVVEVYRQPSGRVRYKEFCDIMENGTYGLQSRGYKGLIFFRGWHESTKKIRVSLRKSRTHNLPIIGSDSQLLSYSILSSYHRCKITFIRLTHRGQRVTSQQRIAEHVHWDRRSLRRLRGAVVRAFGLRLVVPGSIFWFRFVSCCPEFNAAALCKWPTGYL